jgi:hypothetical protein
MAFHRLKMLDYATLASVAALSVGLRFGGPSRFPLPRILAPLPESNRLRKYGPFGGIVRSRHRIVLREIPFLPVLIRGHSMGCEVSFERLKFLPIIKAN